jgi:hypothetical protein
MNNLKLRYGKGDVELDLTGYLKVKVFSPVRSEGLTAIETDLREALRNPIGSSPLSDRARGKTRVVISIPDRTRPPIARRLLPTILAELASAGVGPDRVSIFVATGTHGEHSPARFCRTGYHIKAYPNTHKQRTGRGRPQCRYRNRGLTLFRRMGRWTKDDTAGGSSYRGGLGQPPPDAY